jgi:hypothetical protein
VSAARTGGPRFYAVRQCTRKVVGSRTMTEAEARREVAAWREHIGPAAVVPATGAARRAVRTDDQAALAALLAGDLINGDDRQGRLRQ